MKLSSSLTYYTAALLAGSKAGVDGTRVQPSSFRKLQAMSMDIQEDIPDGEPEYHKGGSSKKSKSRSSDDTPPTFGLAGPSTFNARTGFNDISGDLTLNSNVTCDLLPNGLTCIFISDQEGDDVTLDCNGYSIIGPGPGADMNGDTVGIFVTGSNVIIKNCNVEHFSFGIVNDIEDNDSTTVESTTVSNNQVGIQVLNGILTLKNVLVENNGEGLSVGGNIVEEEVAIDNGYFCNNSDQDIIANSIAPDTCPGVKATGQIFASTFGGACPIEDTINESLEENGFGPIKSCTDLVAQQSLLSDM